jgi:hypothetical protein
MSEHVRLGLGPLRLWEVACIGGPRWGFRLRAWWRTSGLIAEIDTPRHFLELRWAWPHRFRWFAWNTDEVLR